MVNFTSSQIEFLDCFHVREPRAPVQLLTLQFNSNAIKFAQGKITIKIKIALCGKRSIRVGWKVAVRLTEKKFFHRLINSTVSALPLSPLHNIYYDNITITSVLNCLLEIFHLCINSTIVSFWPIKILEIEN